MEKIAVFAGTFDPFTRGHQDIAMRALALFDKIVVAIGKHEGKATLFSLESRRAIIRDTFSSEPRIEVAVSVEHILLFAGCARGLILTTSAP